MRAQRYDFFRNLANFSQTIFNYFSKVPKPRSFRTLYGLNVSSNMLEVKGSTDDYDMEGYICKPEILKSNRNHMIRAVLESFGYGTSEISREADKSGI